MIRKTKDNKPVFPCVRCSKEITASYPLNDKESNNVLSSLMWDGGGVDKFSLNYGSTHDSNVYAIGICDSCLTKLVREKKILYLYNYMSFYDEGEKNILDDEFKGLE